MYIVSACLAGVNCRYNGSNTGHEEIKRLVEEGKAIPLCPEVMAGLPTPRKCSEMVTIDGEGRVLTEDGEDITVAFQEGARKTWEIARLLDVTKAILQTRSPSCGYGRIYDGTFTGQLVKGKGITASLLEEKGIRIYTEDNFQEEEW